MNNRHQAANQTANQTGNQADHQPGTQPVHHVADPAERGTVERYLTSPSGERVARMPDLAFSSGSFGAPPTITIRRERMFQRIEGFGATLNESGWYLLQLLPPEERGRALSAFFDPDRGAGYRVCVAPVGHNDYSLDYYSYNETPGDTEMRDFSIERDRQYLIPYIRAALEYGSFDLATRPDFPPKWMLNGKRALQPQYYDAYARYLDRYLAAYKAEGLPVRYISLFNEPRIYTHMTGEDMRVLLRDHVGPLLRKNHPDVQIQLCDSYMRDQVQEDWTPALEDAQTRQFVDGVGYHSYEWEKQTIKPVQQMHERYPDLPIWQTEVMNLYTVPIQSYADGEVWGKIIVDDLTAGASAWIFWNMVVDEHGGPYNRDPFNTGYPQDGVGMIHQENRTFTLTAKYYYQTHFSRFILPGSYRIAHEVFQDNHPFPLNALYWVRILATIRPDGRVVLVCLNTNDNDQDGVVVDGERHFWFSLPGHSITTYIW